MGIINKIIAALKTTGPEFAQLKESDFEPVQENAFCLRTSPPFFIKYIADDDDLGNNEIWVNQTILPTASILNPRLIFTIKTTDATIAGWEWLDGADLHEQHRDLLPKAFEQLGYFHAQQRHNNPVSSLITRRTFTTIPDLLKAEFEFLLTFHDNSVCHHAKIAISLLETGYPTYIHGDVHPGNIRLTSQGLQFVDWGYCTSSLCWFDLGYVQTIILDDTQDQDWWCITPDEAQLVLPAYSLACGVDTYDYKQIHPAVMFWSELWAYNNCVRTGNEVDARISRQHLERLMDWA